MSDPYTIRVYVPDGNPEGSKIIDQMNWTGVGIAFPREEWGKISKRREFGKSGVYILIGSSEGVADDLPTIYVGQGDEIRSRIENHYKNKDFWNWGYAFVSNGNNLNRAHITWLEYSLIHQAEKAERSHFDNSNHPKEPSLSESELADIHGFLKEILKIMPLLNVKVFEKSFPVVEVSKMSVFKGKDSNKDTIIVPAQDDGFIEVFLGKDCWYAVRIGGGMLQRLKFVAAYQTSPISAITYYAKIKNIEPYGDEGKYKINFDGSAIKLESSIPYGDAPKGAMQGPRYTNIDLLMKAKKLSDILSRG